MSDEKVEFTYNGYGYSCDLAGKPGAYAGTYYPSAYVERLREALQEFVDYDVRDGDEYRDCGFCHHNLTDRFSEGHAVDCVMTKAKALLGGDDGQ